MRSDPDDTIQPEIMRTLAAVAADAVIERLRRNPIVTPEWLSLQDAAAYTGYSEQQLSEFVRTNRAPKSIKFSNNARRFKRSDVDTWCAAGGPSQYCDDGSRPGATGRRSGANENAQ